MVSATISAGTHAGISDLAQHYTRVRRASEALAAPLSAEDCVIQTIPEVSPTKWHIAHVTWFFEAFCLAKFDRQYKPFDERYHYLFNSYYYTVGQMHARSRRGLLNRPLLEDIVDYRRHVDDAMLRLLDARRDDPALEFVVTLGLHHEQQHQELMLTDIKHVFFSNPLAPAYRQPQALSATEATGPVPFAFVSAPGGQRSIGAASTDDFCFDNETPRHDVLVRDHSIGNRLVTNAEFREFIEAGGYQEASHWLADGWALVLAGEIERPWYWSADLTREFSLSGWREIEPESPVCHVSFYEADAFARWAGARLPLETEWELAAAPVRIDGNLLDGGRLHPAPARAPAAAAAGGLHQLWGDVWEWTASPYVAYPGFKPLAGSLGEYNGKFMSNQMVVRGGSCATWQSHLRPTYRSFFYPHDRWQFLGFRLAKDS